jgi:uncharacterized damage-inducible protein DinB
MKLTELFLDQLEKEAGSIRRTLERVPEGRNDWKPHEKSMELGYLAALVATMPAWIDLMIHTDELDLRAPDAGRFRPQPASSTAELIGKLDEALAKGRRALESTNDEHLMKPWRFMMDGQALTEQPRYVMIRDSVFSHLAHHRGQLTVYLRLNQAAVPAIYGPSADERF